MTENALTHNNAGLPTVQNQQLTIGMLERSLLEAWPRRDACAWDRTGMLVGNPADEVRGVAVALDPTIPALQAARDAHANVLLCHHPVFLDAPESFIPASFQGHTPGAVVRQAIEWGISILSFHTALDVSVEGLDALCHLLHLQSTGVLEPLDHDAYKGFGRISTPQEDGGAITLKHLAARCVSVFGSVPRVWGNADARLSKIVTCGGSAGSLLGACLDNKVDCLVCGEVKYHGALDASLSGLCIIELGHDISEFPLCALLAAQVARAGVPSHCITMVDQSNWYTPEAIRR